MKQGTYTYTIVYHSDNLEDYSLIRKGNGKPNRNQVKNHKEFIENGGFNYVDEYATDNPVISINENNEPYLDILKQEQVIQNKWNEIREIRTEMLKECDWTQLSDVNLSEEEKETWREYRQALRDITLQDDPFNIIWPQYD